MNILLGLTNRCNCKCGYCPVINTKSKEGSRELTTEEWKNSIKTLSTFFSPKKSSISFIGGEPLIRKDCLELISYAHDSGFYVNLDTNGTLIDQPKAKALKKAGLDMVAISIDSPDPDVFNGIKKNRNAFQRAMDAFKYCQEEGIKRRMSVHFNDENIENGDFEKNIEFAIGMDVDHIWLFETLTTKDSNDKTLDVRGISEENHEKLRAILKKYDHLTKNNNKLIEFDCGFEYKEKNNNYCGNCLGFKNSLMSINWWGDVSVCVGTKFAFGNVLERTLGEIILYMSRHEVSMLEYKGSILHQKKYGFDVPIGCFGKYEAELINKVPKYKEIYESQDYSPRRIDVAENYFR